MTEALLKVVNLKKHFPVYGGIFYRRVATVYAVDGVGFEVAKGQTLGIVGESGCGKSTLGKTLIRLYQPDDGHVYFEGQDLATIEGKTLNSLRKDLQMVFQDPFGSLNSRHTVGYILEEPFIIHHMGSAKERKEKVQMLLTKVGLEPNAIHKFPHEFSGGQRQRIGIARAIALNPNLVVCDEPVSALDVSIQAQILNLLLELQQSMQLTYVFIAHDLAIVKHISDYIAVMYLGKIVEYGPAKAVYEHPQHPYTHALISAVPIADPTKRKQRIVLPGEVPSPLNPPPGCRFYSRCRFAKEICQLQQPILENIDKMASKHLVACHFKGQLF